jgi:hypothetical protein
MRAYADKCFSLLMEPLHYLLIADCLSDPCTPLLELRQLGLVMASSSIAALPASASAGLTRRVFPDRHCGSALTSKPPVSLI